MSLLKSVLFAAALLLPAAASAAPIPVYTAEGAAFFDGQYADFFGSGPDDIDISVSVEATGNMLFGTLLVSDFSGALLESTSIIDIVLDLQPGGDTATLVFDMLEGPSAALFGKMLEAIFTFSLENENNGVFDPVGVTLYADTVAAIPLPASLGFLVLGLGALAGAARRRA